MKKFFILFLLLSSSLIAKQVDLTFFWGEGCPHCEHEKPFLKKMQKKYPTLRVSSYEVWENEKNLALFRKMKKELNVQSSGLPLTIVGDKAIVGFRSEETTGKRIEEAILASLGKGYYGKKNFSLYHSSDK